MKRAWIISAAVVVFVLAGAILLFQAIPQDRAPGPAGTPAGQTRRSDTARFISLTLNPRASRIAMYWRDDNGTDLRSLERLRAYLEEHGKRLRFAMNGGMYQEDRRPLGLFIQHGKVLSPLNRRSSAQGNFYLKPNGVFLVRKNGAAAVVTTERFTRTRDIAFATQSGPMLLIDGAIHPAFRENSENLNIRNGVGVRPDGRVVFAMSREVVTFHEFATYFKEMGCHDALYLDGFVSRCYLPEKDWTELDGDFGVMIGVAEG